MSADDMPQTQAHTMVRENAFTEAQVMQPQARELTEIEQNVMAEARQVLEQKARNGEYTRAKAISLGVADIEGFKPLTCPYLKTEHVFEREDEDHYEHPDLGKIAGFKYTRCINCGKTFDDLKARPIEARPSIFHCVEKGMKQQLPFKAWGNNKGKASGAGNSGAGNGARWGGKK